MSAPLPTDEDELFVLAETEFKMPRAAILDFLDETPAQQAATARALRLSVWGAQGESGWQRFVDIVGALASIAGAVSGVAGAGTAVIALKAAL